MESTTELLRPWKLASLAVGMALLFAGSVLDPAPDWDLGVSVLMAVVAYATAPWVARSLWTRQWRRLPVCIALTWFGVDGCYALYWSIVDPWALAQMRAGQWPASLCLYALCGMIWMHPGPLKTLLTLRRGTARGG